MVNGKTTCFLLLLDPESGIRDPKGKKIRIRKKLFGSATLIKSTLIKSNGRAKRNQVHKKRYVEQT
jgi:hypothetical protein